VLPQRLFIRCICKSPCSSDYIFPFGWGIRGRVILSSPPSRYTCRVPGAFALHTRIGSVLTAYT
jgi:hypothetical protein